MTTGSETRKMVINVLAALGAILYLSLQCGPVLPLAPPDLLIKNLAFSLMCLIQTVRGLLWQLKLTGLPSWLLIPKMDRRFAADSTVLFILLVLILELTLRPFLDPQSKLLDERIVWSIFALQVGFGLWLMMLSIKKTGTNSSVGALYVLIFLLVFFSPFFLIGAVGYGMYKSMDLHGTRDFELLAAAAIVPLMIATFILFLKDKRNRLKNTSGVIINQFLALPAFPLFFFLLRDYWPKQVSVMVFPVILMIIVVLPALLVRRASPWLLKEKVEAMLARIAVNKELLVTPFAELEAEIAAVREGLGEKGLILKVPADHIDRADTYWKLGDLQAALSRFDDAEVSYREAVNVYNKVLDLDHDNRTAIANKFKTVEALSQVQRQRLQSKQ